MLFPKKPKMCASKRLAAVLLWLCGLANPVVAQTTDLLNAFIAFLGTNPSRFDVVDVPGVGEIPGTTQLPADFELPDGLTFGDPPKTKVPGGTLIVDVPVEAILALTDDEQLEPLLVSYVTPPAEVDADPTYSINVVGVDTRNFPQVSLQFHIIPNDTTSPPFSSAGLRAANFRMEETVLGEKRRVVEFVGDPPVEQCEEKALAISIGVDTSCSVQKVIQDLKDKSLQFAREVLDPVNARSPDDAIAFYAFDGRGRFRAPSEASADDGDGNTPAFHTVENQTAQTYADFESVNVDRPCAGSPIFDAMRKEIVRLANYKKDKDVQKVLVTFADFRDTKSAKGRRALIADMEANREVFVVGLGFGRVNSTKVANVFDLDKKTGSYNRGGFIQNGSADALKALRAVYNGLAYTYCVTFESPFPNQFNEIVNLDVRLTDPKTGAVSFATARYALPSVVPEDTKNPRLFFPLTDRQFELANSRGDTRIVVQPRFVPDLSAPAGRGPPRATIGPFEVGKRALAVGSLSGKGFWLRGEELGEAWDDLFRVPTQYVRLDPSDAGPPRIKGVSRYELDITVRNDDSAGNGSPYAGTPVISVQDRTPPHLLVRLRSSDGRRLSELRVLEDVFDGDPSPSPRSGRLDSRAIDYVGPGKKRARVEYSWVGPDGAEFSGALGQQQWGGPLQAGRPSAAFTDAPGTPVNQRIFTPPEYTSGGFEVNAKTRVEIQVLARDNYAALSEVDPSASIDGQAFSAPEGDSSEGPIHSRFDLNRPGARFSDPAPPFFPFVLYADLLDDPTRVGVSWWIQSADDRDRFDGREGPAFFQYPKEDEAVLFDLAEQGVVDPPFPIRRLEVYAQDGQGNATRLTLPLFVRPASFKAQVLDSQTERVRDPR